MWHGCVEGGAYVSGFLVGVESQHQLKEGSPVRGCLMDDRLDSCLQTGQGTQVLSAQEERKRCCCLYRGHGHDFLSSAAQCHRVL